MFWLRNMLRFARLLLLSRIDEPGLRFELGQVCVDFRHLAHVDMLFKWSPHGCKQFIGRKLSAAKDNLRP